MQSIARHLAWLVASASLFAQAPPAWSSLAVPTGVNTPAVTSIGKLIAYTDSGQLHAYSAFRRSWSTLSVSSSVTLRLTNDCLLVQDGATWHGFAAHSGQFMPLAVSPQAQLLNAVGQDNDSILLVQDGSQLHAFSGFVGNWVSRPVTSSFGWKTQRHVALFTEGNVLSGMDAFSGQWHDITIASPPSFLSCDGTAGLSVGPTEIHAFSAMFANWVAAPAIAGATFVRNDDWAMFYDSTQMLAYSGTRGRFEYAPIGATAIPYSEDCFAFADTTFGLVAFSAIRGAFSAPIAPASARVRPSVSVATLALGNQVIGYSALQNTFATEPAASLSEEAAGTVAYALTASTGLPSCYSAITGAWYTPPADVQPISPLLTTTSALLTTSSGLRAFSARTGNFVPLVASGATPIGNSGSAVAGAWNASSLFAFDARTDRWQSLPRTSNTPLIVQIWRTEMFVIDGNTVAGFGAQEGTWESTVMPEPYQIGRANSESTRIVTANYILCHTALAELTSFAQFPEFRRVFPAGAQLHLYLPISTGDFAVLAGGLFAAAPQAVPGFGTLLLDPTSMVTQFVLPGPGAARAEVTIAIPASPSLVGSEWAFQALIARQNATPYLTGPAAVMVL